MAVVVVNERTEAGTPVLTTAESEIYAASNVCLRQCVRVCVSMCGISLVTLVRVGASLCRGSGSRRWCRVRDVVARRVAAIGEARERLGDRLSIDRHPCDLARPRELPTRVSVLPDRLRGSVRDPLRSSRRLSYVVSLELHQARFVGGSSCVCACVCAVEQLYQAFNHGASLNPDPEEDAPGPFFDASNIGDFTAVCGSNIIRSSE